MRSRAAWQPAVGLALFPAAAGPGPSLAPLLLIVILATVAAAAWWFLRRRDPRSLPVTVRHRLGRVRLPSTHPEFWRALRDPDTNQALPGPASGSGAAGTAGTARAAEVARPASRPQIRRRRRRD
ncbi:MAG: hypothetical protein ACREPA_11965 [Candidatus Dormibacteraceae bacterium]